jgi:hypothetical protein
MTAIEDENDMLFYGNKKVPQTINLNTVAPSDIEAFRKKRNKFGEMRYMQRKTAWVLTNRQKGECKHRCTH